MFEFVTQHQFWAAVGAYWTYSAAVSSMPEPGPDSRGYLWLYRFCHTMAGKAYNVARDSWLTYRGAVATNVPAQAYFTQLTQNLSDLTTAIRMFKEAQ